MIPQIEMKAITKRFGSLTANDHVDFSVQKGEIHSLLGENGAGKTTLMRILYGMTQADEGSIFLGGERVHITSPQDAINHGIAMVHQHFMLVDPMTVAENMVLGDEPRKGKRYDRAAAEAKVRELSEQYGLRIDPCVKVETLPVGSKQRLEILKALYREADILILDEPTAVLTRSEVDDLFAVLRNLRKAGKTIIIITHKLAETMELADRVTILNSGRIVATCETAATDANKLAELMVGRKVSFDEERRKGNFIGAPIVELQNVSCVKNKIQKLKDVSLTLHEGEILGIAGVEGNGQTELVEVLNGLLPLSQGSILVRGKAVTQATPRKMLDLKIGHIPEDRGKRGLIKEFSIQENLVLGYQHRACFSHKGILRLGKIREIAEQLSRDYAIKTQSCDIPAGALSGGNQQKVVVARVLYQDPDVIVAAQPTRGIDIGAIEYIHQKLIEMKQSGKGILLVSAELEEIMKLSDRVAVMYAGQIVAVDEPQNFDEYRLGALMTGIGTSEVKRDG